MKRFIKSSFGYEDSQWVDPEDDFWEESSDSVTVRIDGEVLTTDSNGDVDNWEEFGRNVIGSDPQVYGDHTMRTLDVGSVAAEHVLDEVEESLPSDLMSESTYKVTGTVVLWYTFDEYHGPDRYAGSFDENSVEFHHASSSLTFRKVG